MGRKQPAIFHAEAADGRRWTIRVGPLGIEALTHEAYEYTSGEHTFQGGQARWTTTWRDLLPVGEVTNG